MTLPSTDPLDDPQFWRAVVNALGLNPNALDVLDQGHIRREGRRS
jgi:hypothetical protein